MAAALHPPESSPSSVTLVSQLLGTLEVPADAVVEFRDGLPGFDAHHHFAIVPAGREGLCWLASTEEPALTFLLADPFHWFPDYEIDVPDAELSRLGAETPGDVAVFSIVTLPARPGEPGSVNLRAPVLLGTASRQARQLVLTDDRYAIREPLVLG